MLSICL